ncbi:RicAFT regulatory complex protein RicA family protein [Paenibacillus thermotolerans]|uniref:RicAFT regulatory complex protein RicA family protein n=1 Tax=Paenibacillus thermotolerans TaxID=3027807 RepID=UPI0023676D44|nr:MULTISPECIES: YlbF family regulator [unclassified Paenibacillus]
MANKWHHDGDHGSGCAIESYQLKDLLVREDIMKMAKDLAAAISTSDEVEIFRKAEKQVNQHAEIQQLISSIKKKQKEIVAFETTFKNKAMVEKIEAEIEQLQDRLDAYPVVGQFRQSQADLNYLLQTIFNVIRDTLSEKIALDSESSAS